MRDTVESFLALNKADGYFDFHVSTSPYQNVEKEENFARVYYVSKTKLSSANLSFTSGVYASVHSREKNL